MNNTDEQYLSLVRDILENGELVPTRAKIDGKNIDAISVIGRQARFDLTGGFPILTTKKVSFHNIIHELIWFLKGESNIEYLKKNNVKIWDAWADENGELGYGTYGTMWRNFPYPETINTWPLLKYVDYTNNINRSIDQIKQLIQNIENVKKDPTASCGRRLIVTAWHPYYVDKVGLPPCHCLFQFTVRGEYLSCHLYQRSCDALLGIPYNISSYSLLTYIVAHITGLKPREFIHTYHDLHIYSNHVDQIKEQLTREPFPLPTLWIDPELKNIDDLERRHIKLIGYRHHNAIKGEVAI